MELRLLLLFVYGCGNRHAKRTPCNIVFYFETPHVASSMSWSWLNMELSTKRLIYVLILVERGTSLLTSMFTSKTPSKTTLLRLGLG
mmetsp:Transcript_106120/g.216383  ORF Transcript_106120/g.216383 Transcript_106120/m.216383 type:complete len:87 (+) Transcript_106120:162-422(+)